MSVAPPAKASGETSFRTVRMMAPLGKTTLLATEPLACCSGAASTPASPLTVETRPSPTPIPSKLIASRRVNGVEREFLLMMLLRLQPVIFQVSADHDHAARS